MDGCVINIMTNPSLSWYQNLCNCKEKIWGFFLAMFMTVLQR